MKTVLASYCRLGWVDFLYKKWHLLEIARKKYVFKAEYSKICLECVLQVSQLFKTNLKSEKSLKNSFSWQLEMKHILFAREDTACKHEMTTEKSLKIWPGNPGNIIFARQRAKYSKSW